MPGAVKYGSWVSWLRWAKANREKTESSQMSHSNDRFARNYFYHLRCRNIPALRAKLDNRGGQWFSGASGTSPRVPAIHTSSQRNAKSIRCATSKEKHLPCQAPSANRLAVAEAAPLPSQRQGQVHRSPPTSATKTRVHNELSYRFVLQLLHEVFSWMARYFQDLSQLI